MPFGPDARRLTAAALGVCPLIAVAVVVSTAISDDPYYSPETRSRWDHAASMGAAQAIVVTCCLAALTTAITVERAACRARPSLLKSALIAVIGVTLAFVALLALITGH